jgi:phage baseplate assembly protein W
MAQVSPFPGTGVDRRTGQVLTGWPHVEQSLQVIFTTQFGERVMRRWFGSDVLALLGRNMTNATILRFWSAICTTIDLWEPRFRVTKIMPYGSAMNLRIGKIGFAIVGVYYPRGHLGDYSVSVSGTLLNVSTAGGVLSLIA